MADPYDPYDFRAWLALQIGKDYAEILKAGEHATYDAERRSFGVIDAQAKRERGSIEFVGRITKFLFLLRHGTKPSGVTDGDWHAYRAVVQSLVESGEMKSKVLDLWRR
jgi:hypothetical protein